MMTRLIISALLLTSLVGCDNDIAFSEVPSVVQNTFKSNFPNSRDVEWEKYGDDFEVDFELNDIDYSARIDAKGNLLTYKYDIDMSEIPQPIHGFFEKEYAGKIYDDSEKLVQNGVSYYQMEIEGFLSDTKVVVDSLGNRVENIKAWK